MAPDSVIGLRVSRAPRVKSAAVLVDGGWLLTGNDVGKLDAKFSRRERSRTAIEVVIQSASIVQV